MLLNKETKTELQFSPYQTPDSQQPRDYFYPFYWLSGCKNKKLRFVCIEKIKYSQNW